MTNLLLCDITAFQCWDNGYLRFAEPVSEFSVESCEAHAAGLREFPIPRNCARPVHFISPQKNNRLTTRCWRGHACLRELPPGSVYHLGSGVHAVSPELAYYQASRHLTFVQALRLGMELCGGYSTLWSMPYRHFAENTWAEQTHAYATLSHYSFHPYAKGTRAGYRLEEVRPSALPEMARRDFLGMTQLQVRQFQTLEENGYVNRPPVTTPERLRNYGAALFKSGTRSNAIKALDWIEAGSNSPRETHAYLSLCLPRFHGGYHLPRYKLNVSIPLSSYYQRLSGRSYFVCDGLWEESNLVLEYDGKLHHSGDAAVARDTLRESILKELGFHVVSLTKEHFANPSTLDFFARSIANHLDFPLRDGGAKFQREREYLHHRELRWDLDLYRSGKAALTRRRNR